MYQLVDLVNGVIVIQGSLNKIADHQKIGIEILKMSIAMNTKILNGRYKIFRSH